MSSKKKPQGHHANPKENSPPNSEPSLTTFKPWTKFEFQLCTGGATYAGTVSLNLSLHAFPLIKGVLIVQATKHAIEKSEFMSALYGTPWDPLNLVVALRPLS